MQMSRRGEMACCLVGCGHHAVWLMHLCRRVFAGRYAGRRQLLIVDNRGVHDYAATGEAQRQGVDRTEMFGNHYEGGRKRRNVSTQWHILMQ